MRHLSPPPGKKGGSDVRPEPLISCALVLVVTSPPAMLRQLAPGATFFEAWAVRASIVAWWERAWPPAALAVAALVNVAWIGLIGYALVRLLLVTAQAGS